MLALRCTSMVTVSTLQLRAFTPTSTGRGTLSHSETTTDVGVMTALVVLYLTARSDLFKGLLGQYIQDQTCFKGY